MLHFGFDRASVSPDQLYVQANGLPRRGNEASVTNLTRSTFTPSVIFTNPLNCQAGILGSFVESGTPFVYPIDVVGWQSLYDKAGIIGNTFSTIPNSLLDIPESVFSSCRKGKAAILFCYAYEGDSVKFVNEYGVFWAYDFVHGFCLDKQIPFESVWFFNGNQSSTEEFNDWRSARSLMIPQTFRFRTVDSFHTLYQQAYHYRKLGKDYIWDQNPHNSIKCVAALMSTKTPRTSFLEQYSDINHIKKELSDGKIREKLFLSMAGAARASRRVLAASLSAADLIGRGFVSFPKVEGSIDSGPLGSNLSVRTVFNNREMPQHILKGWDDLVKQLPLSIDLGDPNAYQSSSGAERSRIYDLGDLEYFSESYINIINESHFMGSNQITITEKTTKAIVGLQPFIAVASHLFLGYVRNQGFKTFGRLIDESYDNIKGNYERIMALDNLMNWMKGLSQLDARDLYANLLPEIEHNFNHFKNYCFPYERGLMDISSYLGCEWKIPSYHNG